MIIFNSYYGYNIVNIIYHAHCDGECTFHLTEYNNASNTFDFNNSNKIKTIDS